MVVVVLLLLYSVKKDVGSYGLDESFEKATFACVITALTLVQHGMVSRRIMISFRRLGVRHGFVMGTVYPWLRRCDRLLTKLSLVEKSLLGGNADGCADALLT